MEEWRDVVGYEGLYEISNMGNVRRDGCNRSIGGKRYCNIDLYKDTVCKWFGVHRLVAKAFITNPDNKPEVDHINKNTKDNRVENLRWVTSKENKQTAMKHHRGSPPGQTGEKFISVTRENTYKLTMGQTHGLKYQKRFKTLEEAIRARGEYLNK
jgi:hypothetical protein